MTTRAILFPLLTLVLTVSGIQAESLAPQNITSDGFIRNWLVLKPITGADRWTRDHLATSGGPEKAEPKPGEKTAGLVWRQFTAQQDGAIDLGTQNQALAYAFCRLESGIEREVLIRLGVDDGYALWINGVKIKERHDSGVFKADQEQLVCTLKQGFNRILIKVDNFSGGWGFYFRLVDLSKAPNIPPSGIRSWLKLPTEQEMKNAPWDMGVVVPQGPVTAKITFTSKVAKGEISPLMFGSSLLWWEGYTAPVGGQPSPAWETFKKMGLTCLRFPGGADCHPYRWESVAETVRVYKAAGFWQPWLEKTTPAGHYGYKTFLDLCKKYNIEPILQVSTMTEWDSKTGALGWTMNTKNVQEIDPVVRYAADWVRDVKKNGYKVKYWEIGNEEGCYPGMTGKRYGQWVKRFVRAMKAADPEIKIIVTGHRHDWNTELLKQVGKDIDYLSWHYWSLQEPVGDYPPGLGLIPCKFFTADDLNKAPDDQLYLAHLAALAEGKKTTDYDLFEPIRKCAPQAKVAWTEWNWPAFGSRFNYSMANALLNVEQFFHMAAQDCRIANFWAVTAWNFHMIDYGKPYPYYPTADALHLLRRYAQGRLREVQVDTSLTPVKDAKVPLVTAYACGKDKAWSLFILNHHPSQKAKVTLPNLSLLAVPNSPVTLTRLTSRYLTQGAAENEAHTDYHKVTEEKLPPSLNQMEIELDPHSLYILSQGF
jgi:alpha-L-arabinofuranosidase